jgi:spoIIIJ-associated protein
MEAQPAQESRSSQLVESYLPRLESLLKDWIRHGGFELGVVIRKNQPTDDDPEAPEFVVDFSGPDSDLLVERGASLLNALEYVVFKAVRLDEELFGRITLDCQDWRQLRARELQLTAQVAAERVVESGDPFALSPMSPRERRIVHLALKNNLQVRTVSEGFGPERRVVILPTSPPQHARSS